MASDGCYNEPCHGESFVEAIKQAGLYIACDKENYPTQRPEPEMPEGYEFHRMGRGSNADG